MKKNKFALGILIGVAIEFIMIVITDLGFAIHDPLYGQHPNTVLNNPEYMIDTIVTTSHQNTVVEYKFVKVDE